MKHLLKEDIENVEYGRVISNSNRKSYLKGYNFHFYGKPIDLGLSVKWSNAFVEPTPNNESGVYFQWGDTQGWNKDGIGTKDGKKWFWWDSYKFGSTTSGFTKYNSTDKKTVLDLEDDAVHVHLGGKWRMPTAEEVEELLTLPYKFVYQTRESINDEWGEPKDYDNYEDVEGQSVWGDGQNLIEKQSTQKFCGIKFFGKNGNSCFFKANGYADYKLGMRGYCRAVMFWTSTINVIGSEDAKFLKIGFNGTVCEVDYDYRFMGFSVVGVCDK